MSGYVPQVTCAVSGEVLRNLRKAASKRDETLHQFIGKLLERVSDDDLFNAIMDDKS